MDSPSFRVEMDQRSRRFRVHPEYHGQRVPRVKTAIVGNNGVAYSRPSSYSCSPWEVVSPLRVSVGSLDVWYPYKSRGRVLVLTDISSSYSAREGVGGYSSSGYDHYIIKKKILNFYETLTVILVSSVWFGNFVKTGSVSILDSLINCR